MDVNLVCVAVAQVADAEVQMLRILMGDSLIHLHPFFRTTATISPYGFDHIGHA